MHYDNERISKEQNLELIVYNHEAGPVRRKKSGAYIAPLFSIKSHPFVHVASFPLNFYPTSSRILINSSTIFSAAMNSIGGSSSS